MLIILRVNPNLEVGGIFLTDGQVSTEIGIIYTSTVTKLEQKNLIRKIPFFEQVQKLKRDWLANRENYEYYEVINEIKTISISDGKVDLRPSTPQGIKLKHIKVLKAYFEIIELTTEKGFSLKEVAHHLGRTYAQVHYSFRNYEKLLFYHPEYREIKPSDFNS